MRRRGFSRATQSRGPRSGSARQRVRRALECAAIVLVAVGAGLAHSARATTLTVSPSGAGQFLTIQDAVNAAAAGDTLRLLPGVHEALTARNMGGVIRRAIAWIDKPLHFIGDVTSIVRGDNGDETYGFWSDSAGPQSFEGMQVSNIGSASRLIGESTVRHVMWNNLGIGVVLVGPNALGDVTDCQGYRTRSFGVAAIDRAQAMTLRCEFDGARIDARGVWATDGSSVTVRECVARNSGLIQLEFGSSGLVESCSVIDLEGIGLVAAGQGTSLIARTTRIAGKLPTQQYPRGLISDFLAHVDAEWLNFRNCRTSVIFTSGGTGRIRNSMLAPWTSHSVEVIPYESFPTTFDLSGNCWGTTDSTAIGGSIQDGYDDPTGRLTGWVQFMPLRQCNVPLPAQSMGALKSRFRGGANTP